MILKLKDILPNPFRDLKANPLIEDKIVELVGSINLTGFWDNVVVRKNAEDKYELAYGHHRLAAALRAGLFEADFIVKTLDDATMIQIMDNENRDTYGSTPASLIESVKAIVKALTSGSIPAFEISDKTRIDSICYAPSFVPGKASASKLDAHRRYTVWHVANFLGRTKARNAEPSVVAALNALYLKEKGRFNDSLLLTKDRTGAKVPITTNELLKITNDLKRDVDRVEDRKVKSAEEIAKINAESLRIQAEQKAKEKKVDDERKALVKKLAEAKREEDAKQVKKIKEKIEEKEKYAVEDQLAYEVKSAELNTKVEAAKHKAEAAKQEDAYLPIRKETERIVHLLERRDEEEVVKALARKPILPPERERLRQAAIAKGTWYLDFVAQQFLPPLSTKKHLEGYRLREAAKRRAEEKENS